VYARQLASSGPRLVIDDAGILDRTLKVGVIEWDDVEDATVGYIQGNAFVCMHLREPEKYLRRLSPVMRRIARANRSMGFTDLSLNLSGTDADPEQLRHAILREVAARRFGAASEGTAEGRDDSAARKLRSEEKLLALGIPINHFLPRIEGESEARIRDADAVARRALALYAVVKAANGAPREAVAASLRRSGLWAETSPAERDFLEDPAPPEQARIDGQWRVEAIWPLLWALGHADSLDVPRVTRHVAEVERVLGPHLEAPDAFARGARLRSAREILDEADLIYRMHWATREAGLHGLPPPAGLHPGVVEERHYALNWLTFYAEDWDDVGTDT